MTDSFHVSQIHMEKSDAWKPLGNKNTSVKLISLGKGFFTS